MNFTKDEKEFKLIPRMRNVVELTESLKEKNLNDVIFKGIADGNIKVLAELFKAFAEYTEDGKRVFTSVNTVYDYLDTYKNENNTSIEDLYREVAKVVNDMGFFKKKMTPEELEQEINSPMTDLNMNELIEQSAQKFTDKMVEKEFEGYLG